MEGEGDSLGFTVWDYEHTLGFNSDQAASFHSYTGKCLTVYLEAWRWGTQIKSHSLDLSF